MYICMYLHISRKLYTCRMVVKLDGEKFGGMTLFGKRKFAD